MRAAIWTRRCGISAAALGLSLGCGEKAGGGSGAAGGEAGSGSGSAVGGGLAGALGGGVPPAAGGNGAGGAGAASGTAGRGEAGGALAGPGLGAPDFGPDELDAATDGATITMQQIGAPGWYPSRRDPASGECDAISTATCCMTRHELASDRLSPWNEELILTLRGPMQVKQLVVYEQRGGDADAWSMASAWDSRSGGAAQGIAFDGRALGGGEGFAAGTVGSECLVDVMKDEAFECGPGSVPFCPAGGVKNYGWTGSKLFVLAARMPRQGAPSMPAGSACSEDATGNWYDAPWIGLSHAELVRSGKFGDCHCYAKNPAEWYLADGCGQFNAFEVVNDNNQYRNFELFSTNLFGYHGYVGEGPCGSGCDVSGAAPADLIDKQTSQPATQGGITTPEQGPGVAFRRPAEGFRYVLVLLDVSTRTIQLALIHPSKIPEGAGGLLPALPPSLSRATIDALLALRPPG